MSNLQVLSEPTKSKLAIAHNALKAAVMPKCKYDVEDYTDNGNTVEIDYCVTQGPNFFFDSVVIPKPVLIEFIGEFYSDTVDTFYNGEHDQHDSDATNPAVFLEENMNEVLTDYLNNRHV